MSFSSFGSMIYCILHFHTCTIVYFPVICVHLVLFISCYPVLFLYFIYICMFLFYLSYTLCFCILSVLFLCLYTYFHIKLYCTSCSCNCLNFIGYLRIDLGRQFHRVLYGNDTFENKKDKISSQGKVLTKVMRDADN